jgi:hypothetical protein
LFRGTTAHAAGWLQRLGLAVKAVDCPAIDGIVEWARQLGRSDASALLQKTLDEERIAGPQADNAGERPGQSARRELMRYEAERRRSAARRFRDPQVPDFHPSVGVEG